MSASERADTAEAAPYRAPGAVGAFLLLLGREARAAWDGGGGAAAPAAVFISATVLMSYAIGIDARALAAAGPGALVFALGVTALLGYEQLFQGDIEAGAAAGTRTAAVLYGYGSWELVGSLVLPGDEQSRSRAG